ncbi:MAG: serine/threonine-protein kinase [Allobranchiibius sp.]
MGEVFAGRYELIDLIGEGGMGTVWRVHDRRHDTIVAAKVLRQSDAGALLRFMREQGMRIHHPHVVTPIGWAGEDDKVLFTMPAVEGGSLADLLRRCGPLPAVYTAELLRQLLSALAAVHDAGVIHRDIKPGNLLLEPTGTDRPFVRLTDFGVAIAMDAPRMTTRAMVLGTPGFIAPELMYGGDPSERTDLYAAGVVGMQTLTGVRAGTAVRVSSDDLPPRPAGVPDALWQVLVGLLDPDPARRPESADRALSGLQVGEVAWAPQSRVTVDRLLPVPPAVGEFTGPELEATVYGNGKGGTARLNRVVTRRSPARPRRSRIALVTLLAAPLLTAAALGGIWSLGGDSGSGAAGTADVNGSCRWQDAGSVENSSDGKALTCRSQTQGYRWVAAG